MSEADATVRGSDASEWRDRDAMGRARNARPRDALGRPLPRDAAGEPPTPDAALRPAEALAEAQRLLDAGRPFHAHEVLEAAWKAAPPAERSLWQGLAQIAVGLTHALRGNAQGAAALMRRGAGRLDGYPDRGPYGIDVAGLRARITELVRLIERGGLTSMDPADLAIRLLARGS
jgi:predicted metal-dependent hydrolase